MFPFDVAHRKGVLVVGNLIRLLKQKFAALLDKLPLR